MQAALSLRHWLSERGLALTLAIGLAVGVALRVALRVFGGVQRVVLHLFYGLVLEKRCSVANGGGGVALGAQAGIGGIRLLEQYSGGARMELLGG